MFQQTHASTRGMFQRQLSIDEAALLLRSDPLTVLQAALAGDLPTTSVAEHLLIDGPALLTAFSRRASLGDCDAS